MKNTIMLYDIISPTVELLGEVMRKFHERFGGNIKLANVLEVAEHDINKADVVISVRGETPLMLGCLEYARKVGKKRIFFLDDDLKDIPKDMLRYPKRKKWLMKCIKTCDLLLTTNQLIADEYRHFFKEKRTAIINTSVDEQEINDIFYEQKDIIKIVYAAGEKHVVFFERFIRPVMGALYDRYGEKLEFYFIGVNPCFTDERYKKQTHCIPGMSFDRYTEYMKDARFDIGLAPLESSHFTARKYFNKFIEYAKDGICGIYSNCMPYQLAVKDCENGYFAENNPADWLRVISRAVENHEERIKCIENSQTYLQKHHNSEKICDKLAEDIPELLNYESSVQDVSSKIKYRFRHRVFKVFENMYLTIFSIKCYGIVYTLSRINRKIKKKG